MKDTKLVKASGLSEVNMEMIIASGKVGIALMLVLRQHILDGNGMLDEWKSSVVVPSFKGKRDVMNCGSYRRVKLLEHGCAKGAGEKNVGIGKFR